MALYLPDGVTVYEPDIDNLIRATRGSTILSGGAVSAQAVPNMSVKAASGTMIFEGAIVPIVAADPLAISVSDPSNARIDLVEVDGTTGIVSVKTGTPAATPKPPVVTTGRMFLAYVSVGINASNIQSSNISDRRIVETPAQLAAGTLAQRPSATIMSGGTYFATDAGLSRSNGTTWVSVVVAPAAFPDGTLGAPSVSFINGATTGLRYVSPNALSVVAGGVEAARFLTTALGVNYVSIYPNVAGQPPGILAAGSDTNVGLDIVSKGVGTVRIFTNSGSRTIATFSDAGVSVVNGFVLQGSATGNAIILYPTGSDTNISLNLSSKGTGSVTLLSGTSARVIGNFSDVPSSVNYVQMNPSVTGATPMVLSAGSDTNVGLLLTSKGSGTVAIYTNGAGRVTAVFNDIASSVNYFNLFPSATGVPPSLFVAGTDTNIGFDLSTKGTGGFRFYANGARVLFNAPDVPSAVNNIQIGAAAAGTGPGLTAIGSDTNIDFIISPKGNGVLYLGYASAANGGGAVPTFGTIGGTGPAVQAQNSWLPVKVNGALRFIPIWA